MDLLPFLEVLTQERTRAVELDALVERRLSDGDLRAATRSDSAWARRAAWRRLAARGVLASEEVNQRAVRDPDVMVRAVAAGQLDALDEPDRRALAGVLVRDRIGWLATRGLEALVRPDGAPAITTALTASSPTLRRRARLAAIRDVDAREVDLDRLRHDPSDAVGLVALAETGDRADLAVLTLALADPRSPVRAAASRAVARLDMEAAKGAAMAELVAGRSGRVGRAATAVLPCGDVG